MYVYICTRHPEIRKTVVSDPEMRKAVISDEMLWGAKKKHRFRRFILVFYFDKEGHRKNKINFQFKASMSNTSTLNTPLSFVLLMVYHLQLKCRYQPPIPADQVRPWNEYDYEGGKAVLYKCLCFISFRYFYD